MNRGGWTIALLLGAMALWTLFARGVAGVLTWLPELAEAAGGASLPVSGALSLVPQAVLDALAAVAETAGQRAGELFSSAAELGGLRRLAAVGPRHVGADAAGRAGAPLFERRSAIALIDRRYAFEIVG